MRDSESAPLTDCVTMNSRMFAEFSAVFIYDLARFRQFILTILVIEKTVNKFRIFAVWNEANFLRFLLFSSIKISWIAAIICLSAILLLRSSLVDTWVCNCRALYPAFAGQYIVSKPCIAAYSHVCIRYGIDTGI